MGKPGKVVSIRKDRSGRERLHDVSRTSPLLQNAMRLSLDCHNFARLLEVLIIIYLKNVEAATLLSALLEV